MKSKLSVWFFSLTLIYGAPQPGTVALKSFILPGWGQYALGQKQLGKVFFWTETGLWILTGALQQHARQTRETMWWLAASRAGVENPADKDGVFFDQVGLYSDVTTYNEQMLRDRNYTALYDPASGWGWAWKSSEDQARFRAQKRTYYQARKWVQVALWGIFMNHFTSGLSAWLQARHRLAPVEAHWYRTRDELFLTLRWSF